MTMESGQAKAYASKAPVMLSRVQAADVTTNTFSPIVRASTANTELTGISSASNATGIVGEGGMNSAAHLSTNAVKLGEHLTQLEKYGAGGFKELENEAFRYYGEATQNVRNPNSFRMVREWNPETGGKRTWFETLNPSGGVIQVRPELGTGDLTV